MTGIVILKGQHLNHRNLSDLSANPPKGTPIRSVFTSNQYGQTLTHLFFWLNSSNSLACKIK